MHDIEAREIDVVALCKVDRVIRSLNDFVRLVEIFDGTQPAGLTCDGRSRWPCCSSGRCSASCSAPNRYSER